jgi:stringent starvation protein B
MKVETREVVIKTALYIADDSTEFHSKFECQAYEWRLQAAKVYQVYARGQRSDNTEMYSTKELAERAIEDPKNPGELLEHYSIRTIYLDERFIGEIL